MPDFSDSSFAFVDFEKPYNCLDSSTYGKSQVYKVGVDIKEPIDTTKYPAKITVPIVDTAYDHTRHVVHEFPDTTRASVAVHPKKRLVAINGSVYNLPLNNS